jgi:ligand-binding sensor domain-containing protein/serine phosphatase RsbU (regulator of sigma subunit)
VGQICEPGFEKIDLPKNAFQDISCIIQDHTGFMWFGSGGGGLFRYDGVRFKIFQNNPADSNSISSNAISSLYMADNDILWIAVAGGALTSYNPHNEKFTRYNTIGTDTMACLTGDSSGKIWYGTYGHGFGWFDPSTGEKKQFLTQKEVPDLVKSLYIDSSQTVWAGTGKGIYAYRNSGNGAVKFYNLTEQSELWQNNIINSILPDKLGHLWISTGWGIYDLNPKTGTFIRYIAKSNETNTLSSSYVKATLIDKNQVIWICTSYGLNAFQPNKQVFTKFFNQPGMIHTINGNDLTAIFQDRSGVIWMGYNNNGISRFAPVNPITHYHRTEGDFNTLSGNIIRSICVDKENNIWVGTASNGLNKIDTKTNKVQQFLHTDNRSISGNSINAIHQDIQGNIWVGTVDNGLNRLDQKTNTFIHYLLNKTNSNKAYLNSVQTIFSDKVGNLWIGYFDKLLQYNFDKDNFTTYSGFSGEIQTQAICEDLNGYLWIGSWDGLYRFDKKAGKIINSWMFNETSQKLPYHRVVSLFCDSDNVIWIGTFGQGLTRFDFTTGKAKNFSEKDGLPHIHVYAILPDNKGNLWLSTQKGLAKFNLKTESFTTYGAQDGLQSDEFFWGAAFRSSNGELFVGGVNGLNRFFPSQLDKNEKSPQIVISDLYILNKRIVPEQNSPCITNSITETKKITLTYKDYMMNLEFAALEYSIPWAIKYAYKLEGFNPNWTFVDRNQANVSYMNLKPGKYLFKVIAFTNESQLNQEGATLEICVLPPWWNTWWFRTLVVLFISGAATGFYLNRMNRIKRQNEKLEHLVKVRTTELSEANYILTEQKEEIFQQKEEISSINDQLVVSINQLEDANDLLKDQNEEILQQKETLQEQHKIVSGQNELIRSSIRYGLTIQEAILPPASIIKSCFDSFILYHPKDIVSGDFYWFSEIEEPKDQLIHSIGKVMLAVVDCTGHGVPGAFMSMIGSRLLSFIVNERKIIDPKQVLEELKIGVIASLRQDQTHNDDGMDLVLCLFEGIENRNIKMTFCGAKNSLIYYSSQTDQFITLKGNRRYIGGSNKLNENAKFTNYEIILQPNDIVYMMSDGFIDQCNPERRRYGTPQLIQLLKTVAYESMDTQKAMLDKELNQWIDNQHFRDDITMLGLKIR